MRRAGLAAKRRGPGPLLGRRVGGPAVRHVSHRARIALLRLLLASLLITLSARLTYVQLLDAHKPQQSAGLTHLGSITIPAPRGEIVDSRGRVLVGNKMTHVLTVDRDALRRQPDAGAQVLSRLGEVLGTSAVDLAREITPCGAAVPAPCWIGEPYQPVPVATDINDAVVLAVSEHRELFPGVAVSTQTVLDYPGGTSAAHLLGYTGAVGKADKQANATLMDADTIGRSGLEASYDGALRGVDGQQRVALNPLGQSVGSAATIPPVPGQTLVTSIDADVQQLAEKALSTQIAASRAKGKPATSGAVVVVDPHTGRIIAAASYPTYDPSKFVGGISVADYAKLVAVGANDPLVGRATAGQYAPGSTFKLVSASADVTNGSIDLAGAYPCPGSLNVDGRTKTNFDSESFGGLLSLKYALQVSCDTFFYAPAVSQYYADQARIAAHKQPREDLQRMARAFGVASSPGLDLPLDEQASGSIADRATKMKSWLANRASYCRAARRGYPEESNPVNRAYLTQLASENCSDGWRFFAGNNADTAIGQGDTTVSPVQLAMAYSALVNGGTLYAPTLGWALMDGNGRIVRTVTPKVVRKVPVKPAVLKYIADALHFEDSHSVSGALAFDGSPIKTRIGGKTGTAEVFGKKDTSWFASWGPVKPGASAQTARFVAVGMVEQAGLGSSAAAPMIRAVFEGMLGAHGKPVLPHSRPATSLPTVILRSTGTAPLALPAGSSPWPTASPSPSPSPSPSASAGATPSPSAGATSSPRAAATAAASSVSSATLTPGRKPNPGGTGTDPVIRPSPPTTRRPG